ncbi:transposase and inactivated derivatives-like protein [Tolypothrix sp. NIES-4075]|nr:hypothetical protein [Tolypothrix sp. NIES-4075]GAX45605.1 transposase and inactivated derivatives-like protein [Tolypothrix sp. NIES-4075]
MGSIATRFYRWQKAGIWNEILERLQAIAYSRLHLRIIALYPLDPISMPM